MGWRRSDLVRRRSAHTAVRHRCPRNRWPLQPGPSLPEGGRKGVARPSGIACRHARRHELHRSCAGQGTGDALRLERRGRGQSYRRLLHIAALGRPLMRDGARWFRGALEPILGKASLQVSWPEAAMHGILFPGKADELPPVACRCISSGRHGLDGLCPSRKNRRRRMSQRSQERWPALSWRLCPKCSACSIVATAVR